MELISMVLREIGKLEKCSHCKSSLDVISYRQTYGSLWTWLFQNPGDVVVVRYRCNKCGRLFEEVLR
jgi:DNA-directed RNA polymerase subunit RPC12/RpoP